MKKSELEAFPPIRDSADFGMDVANHNSGYTGFLFGGVRAKEQAEHVK